MERTRRVGTISLGLVLVLFGILFLLHLFFPALPYTLIMQFWPCIFIFLGAEILFCTVIKKDTDFKYDFGAIVIICMLSLFAMGMACMDYIITSQIYR